MKNLKKLRLKAGLTQEKLAEKVGWSARTVRRHEDKGVSDDATIRQYMRFLHAKF